MSKEKDKKEKYAELVSNMLVADTEAETDTSAATDRDNEPWEDEHDDNDYKHHVR